MWTCPNCNRQFKNRNQEHSCAVTDLESHFFGKEPGVMEAFGKLHREVSKFGPLSVNPVKHAILFTRGSHFMAVKPKRKWLDIEFALPRPVEGFPVHRTVQATRSKWAHFIRIGSAGEVDDLLLGWLREAYESSR